MESCRPAIIVSFGVTAPGQPGAGIDSLAEFRRLSTIRNTPSGPFERSGRTVADKLQLVEPSGNLLSRSVPAIVRSANMVYFCYSPKTTPARGLFYSVDTVLHVLRPAWAPSALLSGQLP